MTEELLLDWRGTPIAPGARIVYPVRGGSIMDVIEAEVLSVHVTEEDTRYGRTAILPTLKVRRLREAGIVGWTIHNSESAWDQRPAPHLTYATSRSEVRITEVYRVTVVEPAPAKE